MMIKFIALGIVLLIANQAHAATWKIVYPQPVMQGDIRQTYPISLLKLALDKTGVRYDVRESIKPLSQAKSLRSLRENIDVNVVWSMTDIQREEEFLPIRIPISKGLIGWRVFMTHKDKPFYNKQINSLEDLLVYSPVQGMDWPDTKILQANGFNVVTAQNYAESLDLLQRKQADSFPRAISEALQEMNMTVSDPDIRLRKDIAVVYPAAMYFFVNKRNKTLANLIEVGLTNALADGSFDELFLSYHEQELATFDLSNIVFFELDNPLLPPLTPVDEARYWYRPE